MQVKAEGSMVTRRRLLWRRVLALVVAAAALVGGVPSTPVARADATTSYYINNQAGAHCDDAGTGTDPAQPWCDFEPVNGRAFGPDDHILLARGATWTQPSGQDGPMMTISGQGSATSPAVVDAYGPESLPRPRLFGNGAVASRVIRMNNPSYWRVSNLEIGLAGTGILVYYDSLYHQGLQFDDIYVHDVRGIHQANGDAQCRQTDRIFESAGIEITGDITFTSADYALKDLQMTDIEGTHNQDSVSIDWCNGIASTASGLPWSYVGPLTADGGDGDNLVQDATLQGLYLHDDNGPSAGCDDSLRLTDMRNVTIMDSILNDEAACHSPSGTAAVILQRLENVNVVNSIVTNVPDTTSHDMTGFDYEMLTDHVRVLNTYIAGNAGPGLELLTMYGPTSAGPSDHSTNNDVSDNTFVDNGAGIRRVGSASAPSGTIQDNLYFEPGGFLTGLYGDFTGYTVTNNLGVSTATDVYNAAHDFDASGSGQVWSYQYSTDAGATWADLTYSSTTDTWQQPATAGAISQFDQYPGSCGSCAVARTWTAPQAGMVSIRGRVLTLEPGAAGPVASITRNNTTIWGPQALTSSSVGDTGIPTNLDSVAVGAGDVLRFIIANSTTANNGSSTMSWAPSVGYPVIPTPEPASTSTPTMLASPTTSPTGTPLPPTASPTGTPILPTNTATSTPLPPTNTATGTPTSVATSPGGTPVPSPAPPTNTPMPSPAPPTGTPVPPTPVPTGTPVPPTPVPSATPVPPASSTATSLPYARPATVTCTGTSAPATATATSPHFSPTATPGASSLPATAPASNTLLPATPVATAGTVSSPDLPPPATTTIPPLTPTRIPARPATTPTAPKARSTAVKTRSHALPLRICITHAAVRQNGTEIVQVQTLPAARVSAAIATAAGRRYHGVSVRLRRVTRGRWTILLAIGPRAAPGVARVMVVARLGKQHARARGTFRVVSAAGRHSRRRTQRPQTVSCTAQSRNRVSKQHCTARSGRSPTASR